MPSLWPAVDGPSFLKEEVQVKRAGQLRDDEIPDIIAILRF